MASVPGPLSNFGGIYRKYKEDTDFCIQWLVSSAERVGHNILQYRQRSRLTTSSSKWTLEIPTRELLPLAHSIAERWPTVQISSKFVRCLEESIRARKLSGMSFSNTTDPEILASNERHQHFIGVLEAVLSLLKPLKNQQEQPRRTNYRPPRVEDEDAPPPVPEATNLFDTLKLYTKEEETTTGEAPVEEAPTSKTNIPIERDNDSKEADRFFALFCLLVDLHRIRCYARKTWVQYKNREVDLITASVVSNTAIDIVNKLQTEVFTDLGINEYNSILFFFLGTEKRTIHMKEVREAIGSCVDTLGATFDPHDFLFFKENVAATLFLHMLRQNSCMDWMRVGMKGSMTAEEEVRATEAEKIVIAIRQATATGQRLKSATPFPVRLDLGSGQVLKLLDSVTVPHEYVARIDGAFFQSMNFQPTPDTTETDNTVVDEVLASLCQDPWVVTLSLPQLLLCGCSWTQSKCSTTMSRIEQLKI